MRTVENTFIQFVGLQFANDKLSFKVMSASHNSKFKVLGWERVCRVGYKPMIRQNFPQSLKSESWGKKPKHEIICHINLSSMRPGFTGTMSGRQMQW